MQIIKREELPEQRQVRLTIAVDKDTWQASLARCYQGVKSVCPVAGEPTRENLEQAYGPEFLYQEAVNDTYPQALVEAISQSDIQIAGTPTLSVETIGPDGYTFAAVIDLYPEVELGQYKGLSAVYPQVELSNDDTEAALDEYARANPDVQHPERAAMGDEVTLDFEGFVDGVPFEGGKGEQYPLLLGSGYFIPGFEEQVAGAAVGEERDVKVTFPTEYVPELAGKDAVFHIKVHQITRRAMPEWDDDFARRQGFADVSALRRGRHGDGGAEKAGPGRRAVRQRPDPPGDGGHDRYHSRCHGGEPAGRADQRAAGPPAGPGRVPGAVSGDGEHHDGAAA